MRKKDYYYHRAKNEGYRSRAAFKLIQINRRFYVIKRGYVVVDLGASPGGWSQVANEIVGETGRVIAIDLKSVRIPGVEFIKMDVFSDAILEAIKDKVQKVDAVLSDLSPKISGIHSLDHAKSIELAERAFFIAENILRDGGNMVTKVFQGDMLNGFVRKLKNEFDLVKIHKPKASNPKSSETYVICKRFRVKN